MKYQIEYPGNPDCIYVHVDVYMANRVYPIYEDESDSIRVLFDSIERVNGVDSNPGNGIHRYRVGVYIGKAFNRVEVGKEIAKVIQQWAIVYNLLEREDVLEQLPTLRSDIHQKQCSECQREQERAMRDSMEMWESLDRWDE